MSLPRPFTLLVYLTAPLTLLVMGAVFLAPISSPEVGGVRTAYALPITPRPIPHKTRIPLIKRIPTISKGEAGQRFWAAYRLGDINEASKWVRKMELEKTVPYTITLREVATQFQLTPLMFFSYRGELRWVKLLVKARAKVEAVDETERSSVLKWAARGGNADVVRTLIKAGAQVNSLSGPAGNSGPALVSAAAFNHPQIVLVLLHAGASVDKANAGGGTALVNAAARDALQCARILVDAGANVNAQPKSGWTPLHFAVQVNDEALVKLLLQAGARPNTTNSDGWTPLHMVARYSNAAICQRLLDAGAKVDAKTKEGWTPLHWAASQGNSAVVRVLLSAGANADAQTNDGQTPDDLAQKNGKSLVPRS